jgi:hypothetical protein
MYVSGCLAIGCFAFLPLCPFGVVPGLSFAPFNRACTLHKALNLRGLHLQK